eukprot:scpid62962/ scgid8946/ 
MCQSQCRLWPGIGDTARRDHATNQGSGQGSTRPRVFSALQTQSQLDLCPIMIAHGFCVQPSGAEVSVCFTGRPTPNRLLHVYMPVLAKKHWVGLDFVRHLATGKQKCVSRTALQELVDICSNRFSS